MAQTPDSGRDPETTRRGFLTGLAAAGVALAASGDAPAGSAPAVAAPKTTPADARARSRMKPPARTPVDAHVHLNQVGFLPGEPKRAVVPATGPILGGGFVLLDDDAVPTVRHRGRLSEYQNPVRYGHYRRHFFADFGEFRRPGRYRLRLTDGHLSAPFTIGADVYERMVPLVLRYFDVQRCGDHRSEHRGPCHRDDGVAVGGPRDGHRMDAAGGWHDAGDYMKFVETTSYVTAVMLFAYDRYEAHYTQALARHARRGGLPIPLAYAKVGLDWLLKMHPSPTEFYYQVGDETDHDTWRLPERDTRAFNRAWKPRPVFFGVGANLAGRTAAALALASRLYRSYDPPFAARCLSSAESVYQLGLQHPRVLTTRPSDFYPEETWQDDMEWGAIDLYRATGRRAYLEQARHFAKAAGPSRTYTSVYNVHAMAHATLYPYAPPSAQEHLREHLRIDAEDARSRAASNPYGLGTPYVWGTAEAAAGAALTCLAYAGISGRTEFVEVARRQRDFILGCNPFGLSCLIGAGTRYPLFPHHPVANIRNIELTGAVVGGPADTKTYRDEHTSLTDVEFSTQSPSPTPPADRADEIGVYHDVVQDYVTNEPANDYTAKFLLLTASYIDPIIGTRA